MADNVIVRVGETEWVRGEDGFSPEVTIEDIAHGHRVTITDREHPEGQSIDLLNGYSAYEQAVAGGYTGTEAQFNEELAAFNQKVEDTEQARDEAEFWADGAINANQWAQSARDDAYYFSGQAEKWAVGKNAGQDVPSSDPTYHNNAKYYAQEAGNAVAAVNAAKADALQAVENKSTAEQAAVEQKGEEVIASIPADYTDLTEDVSDLKSAVSAESNQLSNTGNYGWVKGHIAEATGAEVNTSGVLRSYARSDYIPLSDFVITVADPALWEFRVYYWAGNSYLGVAAYRSTPLNVKDFATENYPTATQFRVTVHCTVEFTDLSVISDAVWIVRKVEENPFDRHIIKGYGETINGFTHAGFPVSALFNGKEVIAFRIAVQHATPTDSTKYGTIALIEREIDGTWGNYKLIDTSAIVGLQGELNGPNLTISKDGNYLFLATAAVVKTSSDVVYQAVILQLDKTLNVVHYKLIDNCRHVFWGNTLTTPSGKILQTAWLKGYLALYRSTSAFTGDISALTFELVAEMNQATANELCAGYYNNKLVLIARREGYDFQMTYTENLEGDDGWQARKVPINASGYQMHDPRIPPYWHGEVLPFSGARKIPNGYQRYPVIGFVTFDADNANYFTMQACSSIDKELEAQQHFSGYCDLTYYGGGIFGMPYYRECDTDNAYSTANTQAAVYYKQVNIYAACPNLAHFSLT